MGLSTVGCDASSNATVTDCPAVRRMRSCCVNRERRLPCIHGKPKVGCHTHSTDRPFGWASCASFNAKLLTVDPVCASCSSTSCDSSTSASVPASIALPTMASAALAQGNH